MGDGTIACQVRETLCAFEKMLRIGRNEMMASSSSGVTMTLSHASEVKLGDSDRASSALFAGSTASSSFRFPSRDYSHHQHLARRREWKCQIIPQASRSRPSWRPGRPPRLHLICPSSVLIVSILQSSSRDIWEAMYSPSALQAVP